MDRLSIAAWYTPKSEVRPCDPDLWPLDTSYACYGKLMLFDGTNRLIRWPHNLDFWPTQ